MTDVTTTTDNAGIFDMSSSFAFETTGPVLADARRNNDAQVELNGQLYIVPAPGIELNHPTHGKVYATEVYIRLFCDTMQTTVYDGELEKYVNISQHFRRYQDVALDWYGGDKCGWIRSADREKLKDVDPIAYAKAKKAKLQRNLFGTMRMVGATTADGTPVEVEDQPFRMKLGPANFFDITKVYSALQKLGTTPIYKEIKLNYRLDKRGTNKYIVLEYDINSGKDLVAQPGDMDLRVSFNEIVDYENEQVATTMRGNMHPAEVSVGVFDHIDDDFGDVKVA
jgi:hypothetical protein|tara:strand:+ start:388 stop:1233 length:846 start_codon:yes stop_codon:yes gene_type:complete